MKRLGKYYTQLALREAAMESYSTYSRLKWETKASILHVIEKNMITNEQVNADSSKLKLQAGKVC